MVDWREVDDVFHAAASLPRDERSAFVATRCRGRAELQHEILTLLDAHDASDGFLEPLAPDLPPASFAPSAIGARIGPYALTRLLGHGGMGSVYLATRVDGAFSHDVAIKLTRAVLDVEVSRRFAAERQILASLQHPNIVTLFDGGTTVTGQAYLVMEYVEGRSIVSYVDHHRLPLGDRLRLFQHVCTAIHFAHQHGVVHCDVKPANVLVTAAGVPKVLDFGVARLAAGSTGATADAMTAMTPNYASPEQLRGQRVTIASDVYALGVLLFELVAGTRPYDVEGQPLDVALARVLETRSGRPSVAARGQASLPYDASRIGGDLDAVVAKSMRVDAGERYDSAAALADDLGRVLAGNPVIAREPSFAYLARKLVARHRAATTMAAAGLLAVIAALGAAVWQQQRAEAHSAAAQARFEDVRRLANALIFKLDETIRTNTPTEARRVVVAEALAYLSRLSAISDDPGLRLELAEGYRRIGEVQGAPGFSNLGDRDGARSSFARAIELAQPLESLPAYRTRALAALVAAHRLSASVQADRDRSRESVRAAAAAAERWVAIERSDEARRALGSAQFALAINLGWPASRPHWEAAGREFESLLAERPADPDRMRNVALVDKYLATNLPQTEAAEKLRRAERAATLDARRLESQPGNRATQIDAAIAFAQLASLLEDPSAKLPLYERSLALREQVAAADPADRFAQTVWRRALVQVAATRLAINDRAKAHEFAERALTAFETDGPDTDLKDELRWRASAALVSATAAARGADAARACRRFAQGAADIATLRRRGSPIPGDDLRRAQETLPHCAAARGSARDTK
jgi:hypothetical protein